MKLERSKVEFPLWRKKVDKSLFDHSGTMIPAWACKMWDLPSQFSKISSRKDPDSEVSILFKKKKYMGWITTTIKGRKTPAFRLWFEEGLSLQLKHTFVMSYMRSLETALSPQKLSEIEKLIPFWEFLDIEFDHENYLFKFVAYFTQEPSFPHLFSRLVGSPSVARIDDEVAQKKGTKIYKQDWKKREEIEFEIGATNVIYMLADTKNKLFYIGEAKDLVKRLSQQYKVIPNWNLYRYDALPNHLESYRVPIERMLIRNFAVLLKNNKDIESIGISDFTLANEKIDK